jgi:hypothetical protein
MTVLTLETGKGDVGSGAGVKDTAGSAGSSSTGSSSTGSSRGRHEVPAQGSLAQAAAPGSVSQGRRPAGSASNSGGLSNGVRLDSLTPLARGLFGLLGVDQRTLLLAASGVSDLHSTAATVCSTGTMAKDDNDRLMDAYSSVLEYQVSWQQLTGRRISMIVPSKAATIFVTVTCMGAQYFCSLKSERWQDWPADTLLVHCFIR